MIYLFSNFRTQRIHYKLEIGGLSNLHSNSGHLDWCPCHSQLFQCVFSLELSHWSKFMTLAQAFTLAQNHEHNHIVLANIVLAGPNVLLSFAQCKWTKLGMSGSFTLFLK